MFQPASHWRRFPQVLMMLACGALGICGMALALAAPVGVGCDASAHQAQAAAQGPGDRAEEAPTGFNNSTNGLEPQDAFDRDSEAVDEVESITDGLGAVYKATGCVSCHQNPVSGSSTQVAELRAGHHRPDPADPKRVIFVEAPGGSLIHQRP